MRNPTLRGTHNTRHRGPRRNGHADFVVSFEFRLLRRGSVGDTLRSVDVRCAPSKTFAALAYALAAAGTFLWVGCVLPSGTLLEPSNQTDAATPMFRQAHVLVPTLLLLVLLPAAAALSRRLRGLRALLAGIDAFIAFYAAGVIWLDREMHSMGLVIACALLVLLGSLSVWEALRNLGAEEEPLRPNFLRGVRLCLCLMVLMAPSQLIVRDGGQGGEFLVPFLLLAVSASGAQLARSCAGARRACAMLLLALAILQVIALRHGFRIVQPQIDTLGPFGRGTAALSWTVLGLSLLMVLASFRKESSDEPIAPVAGTLPRVNRATG